MFCEHFFTVADIMRKTRLAYHYAIRKVKRLEKEIISDRFAESIFSNKDRDFWSEVKHLGGKGRTLSSMVDDCTTPSCIAALFADKYQDLYTTVAYNEVELSSIVQDLNESLAESGFDIDCIIAPSYVADAINKLKPNKNDGNLGLTSDHIKLACLELNIHIALLFTGILTHGCVPHDFHIALLFTGILTHGCVPHDFTLSTVVPIPKAHNANLTDSANYRGISLSSIFGKILDLIVLNRYSDNLITSDLQFGFKAKRSTNMCSLILKECVSYYNNNHSTVYCTMLDATKAFDRVEYCKLFRQLMLRKIPPIVIRLLLNMYVNHSTRVSWNGFLSDPFSVKNGVKQGGVLSPVLFCIYFDGLLFELAKSNVGCFIGNFFVGALAYADDVALMAPTPRAMRTLLAVCDRYASQFHVIFNANKSKCIICTRNSISVSDTDLPTFSVGGSNIEIVKEWPHLGHIISYNLSDSSDIQNRRNSLIGQINNILCYFGKLDCVTKNRLIKAYCGSFYGCELWDLWDDKIQDICKAWRHGQRAVWKLPYDTHCRYLSILCNSLPIEDVICCRFLSFVHQCIFSQCSLVQFIVRHGLLYGGMFSVSGSNALCCANRYSFSVGDILSPDFSTNSIKQHCIKLRTDEDIDNVSFVFELICLRDNIFAFSDNRTIINNNNFLLNENLNDIIAYVCST